MGTESTDNFVTVTQLSLKLKQLVETSFGALSVRGEISGLKRHTSGHVYFSLKDGDSVISAVCWRGTRCNADLTDGLEIICSAKVTTYQLQSKYQLVVTSFVPYGQGAILKVLEDRKKKLATEGLFDASNKKKLPYLPKTIGVITSPTGAVIKDILHRVSDRFPVRIILWGVLVQGDGAAQQIADGINGFNNRNIFDNGLNPRPDVIIVARGGGSFEDLMPFNEEVVVRAVAKSEIPIISGVGHETDTTLIDYVADMRAPTPTAAAEMALPVREKLIGDVLEVGRRLTNSLKNILSRLNEKLINLSTRVPSTWQFLGMSSQKLDYMSDKMKNAFLMKYSTSKFALSRVESVFSKKFEFVFYERRFNEGNIKFNFLLNNFLKDANKSFEPLQNLLDKLSFENTLKRGFSIVQAKNGELISSVKQMTKGVEATISFKDGKADVKVSEN